MLRQFTWEIKLLLKQKSMIRYRGMYTVKVTKDLYRLSEVLKQLHMQLPITNHV